MYPNSFNPSNFQAFNQQPLWVFPPFRENNGPTTEQLNTESQSELDVDSFLSLPDETSDQEIPFVSSWTPASHSPSSLAVTYPCSFPNSVTLSSLAISSFPSPSDPSLKEDSHPSQDLSTRSSKKQPRSSSQSKLFTPSKLKRVAKNREERIDRKRKINRINAQNKRNREKELVKRLTDEREQFLKIGQEIESCANIYCEIFKDTKLTPLGSTQASNAASSLEDREVTVYQKRIPQIVETVLLEAICRKDEADQEKARLEERIKKLEHDNQALRQTVVSLTFPIISPNSQHK